MGDVEEGEKEKKNNTHNLYKGGKKKLNPAVR